MWTMTQARFEEVFVKKWHQMSVKTPRRVFTQIFQKELKLFLEEEAFDAAVKAEEENVEIPVAVLSRLLRSQVGQQLFQVEAQNAKWLEFLEITNKRLQDLIHLDWAVKDRDNFFAASKAGVKDLMQSGFQVWGKYEVSCSYFNHANVVHVSNLSEVPIVMYQLLLRQIVVNTGQISAMPWQEHLKSAFGGSIPGIPEQARVDTSILQSISGAREILVNVLKDCRTYDAMARELRLARDSVRAIDPYFYLEEDFFLHQVPGLVEKLVYDKVLAVLPLVDTNAKEAGKTLETGEAAYKELAGIQACALVRHSLHAVGKAVNGAMMILRAMLDGESLTVKAVRSSSDFHKLLYQRCANFLIFDHQKAITIKGQPTRFLYGAAAMERHVDDMDKAVAANKPIDLAALKVFRQFRWLLAPEDDNRIQKLIVDERRKRQNFLETRMIKDDTAPDDGIFVGEAKAKKKAGGDIVAASVSKGSKSSSTSSSKDVTTPILEPKEKKAKLSDGDDMDARMALFLPKWMAANKKK
jgi:hypothetical protein